MLSYSFANLCGAPFEGGHVQFSADGNSLLSPVQNRLCIFDLMNSTSYTLPCESRRNIHHICLHPDGKIAITIDTAGNALVIHLMKGCILHRLRFKSSGASTFRTASRLKSDTHGEVTAAAFSPDGAYFAVAVGKRLQLWESPLPKQAWQLNLLRQLGGHIAPIVSVDWSPDSQFLCTSAKDLTVRLWSAYPMKDFEPIAFVEHRSPLRGAFFSKDMHRIFSVSREGVLISWKWEKTNEENVTSEISVGRNIRPSRFFKDVKTVDPTNEEESSIEDLNSKAFYSHGIWKLDTKAYCNQTKGSKVSHATFHKEKNLLVLGYTGGVFGLYECPEFNSIYSLSIGGVVDTLAINKDGEWLAVGVGDAGQLIVWEWKSETFILKQQGHHYGIHCLAFSPPSSHALGQEKNGRGDIRPSS
ncbi:hypothetical protein IE077_003866, partial [Cardiosporidium cionae]